MSINDEIVALWRGKLEKVAATLHVSWTSGEAAKFLAVSEILDAAGVKEPSKRSAICKVANGWPPGLGHNTSQLGQALGRPTKADKQAKTEKVFAGI